MSEPQASEKSTGATGAERCVCNEVMGRFRDLFGIPPTVHQHLSNSRIEFLKAIRAAIDDRIEHLSRSSQHGAKISVE